MYQSNPLTPIVPTVLGAAVLPNTGGNETLFVASIASIVIGSVILLTTVARQVAKKAYSQK